MCHMSGVTCHMSCVTSQVSSVIIFFLLKKWWNQSVEGLLSTGPTPSNFVHLLVCVSGFVCLFFLYLVRVFACFLVFVFWLVCLFVCSFVFSFVYLPVSLFIHLFVCLCLFVSCFVCLFLYFFDFQCRNRINLIPCWDGI